jgi:hypothetical protein
MDDQDLVFARFPHAEAREEPSIFEHGVACPIEMAHWAIYSDVDLDSEEIGRGRTEDLAWKHAANEIERLSAAEAPNSSEPAKLRPWYLGLAKLLKPSSLLVITHAQ